MASHSACLAAWPENSVYKQLGDHEIRLMHLLPGAFEDDICFSLIHETLLPSSHEPTESSEPSLTRRSIQKTLPEGWRAFKTPEGRWFFAQEEDDSYGTLTYEHPSPDGEKHLSSRMQSPTNSNAPIPEYEALSYPWGKSKRRHVSYIAAGSVDTTALRPFEIGGNLNTALRHLRHSTDVRVLWVDAVCINQQDTQERNAQILRMDDIFRLAGRVVVWLGLPSDDSAIALDMLKYLGDQLEISDDDWRFPSLSAECPELDDLQTPLRYSEAQWDALLHFFQRAWFQRLWVIQEVLLANANATFYCGRESISFYRIRRAIAALFERVGVPAELSHLMDDKRALAYGLTRLELIDLVNVSRQHLCSDPRDKIYGVLGLLGPKAFNGIAPSYDKSYENVFQDIFLDYTQISGRLDLLMQCYPDSRSPKLPTWVTDWCSYPQHFRLVETGFQAAGMSRAIVQNPSRNVLEVTGIRVGSLKSLYEPSADDDDESLVNVLHELKLAHVSDVLYPTGEGSWEAWARTLCLDCLDERYVDGDYDEFETWLEVIRHAVESLHASKEVRTAALERLGNATRDTLENMKFFTTSDGLFGFGTMNSQKNDCLCVLLGLATPLIIRPSSNDCFEVVGWSYIHGLMDSEALLGPLPPGWTIQQHYSDRRYFPSYVNTETGVSQKDDPRLEPLPEQWHRTDVEVTADDPVAIDYFQNQVTGEIINHDPRLSPEMLQRRGVKLETFRFI